MLSLSNEVDLYVRLFICVGLGVERGSCCRPVEGGGGKKGLVLLIIVVMGWGQLVCGCGG